MYSVYQDLPSIRASKNTVDIKYHRYKSVANHFTQAGHSIHSVCGKGLWLLLADNARDRKDIESYLNEKLGSRKPGGGEWKTFKNIYLFSALIIAQVIFIFSPATISLW